MTSALALAAVLVACGSDDSGTESAGSGAQGTTPTTAAATAGVTTTAAPVANATVNKATNDRFGAILVDSQGRTLYTFDRDTVGDGYEKAAASACSGNCAQTWPPLVLPAGTVLPVAGAGVSGLSSFPRDDGANQVAVNGKALYLYAGDTKPGDVTGDGVGGVWHVAKG